MSYIKEFDPRLCFIGNNEKASALVPQEAFPNNPKLSKLVAYCFLIISKIVTDSQARFYIEPDWQVPVNELFPFIGGFLTEPEEDCWLITNVKVTSKQCYDGILLKPLHVGNDSQIVYNIHYSEAEVIQMIPAYVAGALNYFTCVIRGASAGSGKVIWKDPVALDTRLKDETYDTMFDLYLADKYLRLIDETYPDKDPQLNLAKCMNWIDLLVELIGREATVEEKIFDITAPIVKSHAEVISASNVNVLVDEDKRLLSDVLYFLLINKSKQFRLLVTGFDSYTHLARVAELYPDATIEIWDDRVSTKDLDFASVTKSKLVPATLAKIKYRSGEDVLLVSGLKVNDVLLKKFKGKAMVKVGTTVFVPQFSFVSCFASADSYLGNAIIGGELISADKKKELKLFKNHANWFNTEYRNTRAWNYPTPSGSVSYDEAFLTAVQNI